MFHKKYEEKADKFFNEITDKLKKIKISSFIKYEPVSNLSLSFLDKVHYVLWRKAV